ncbi:MAG: TonB-dependent receptor [Bacteroidales bacterium]|nr:TonB-dependent receptor [Bacteroidales bacterium]
MRKRPIPRREAFRFRRFENKAYSAYNSMHRCVTIGVLSVTLVALSASRKAEAQVAGDTIPFRAQLQEVEISEPASEPLNQAGRIVAVLTRQDIDAIHAESVQQLLAEIAGIDVQQRGAGGIQADIALRGGTFDQTAVLLNGINLTNPHTGHYSLDIPVNVADIERIEIIRGPSSIVYGASAFSGGINIITKKDTKRRVEALLEAGQYAYWNAELSLAQQWGNDENSLSLSRKSSNGYIANSDYVNYNALYQNRLHLKSGGMLHFQAGYNYKDYGANTFYSARYPNQHDHTQSAIASVKGSLKLADNLLFAPSAYYNLHTDEFELEKDVSKPNYHLSNVLGTNIAFRWQKGDWSLNFGGDVRYEGIRSSVLGDPVAGATGRYNHAAERATLSAFLQGNWEYGRWLMTAGLMGFQNTRTPQGLNAYPSVNLNYRLGKRWALYALANTASRMPTYTELYYQDAVHLANPNLKQEKSRSVELGAKYAGKKATATADLFYMQGRDMIDWMKETATDAKWQSRNINEVEKWGAEVQAKVFLDQLAPWTKPNTTLTVGYSYMSQKQNDLGYISAYALNYLRHKATCLLSVPVAKRMTFNVAGRYCLREGSFISYQEDAAGKEQGYKPYFLLDANVRYTLGHVELSLSATNLLDEDYYDIGNIPQPGRWLTVGVKARL